MTTVQIILPDQLAREAQSAGLLSPELLERWLREQLESRRDSRLFSAMERMDAVDDPETMSAEDVAEELSAMRAERRANGFR